MIGQFVTSKAGHDKAQCYVIIREEGDFVYLCDGRLKRLEAPKKKRRKHIQVTNRTVKEELLQKLQKELPVTDEEIKYEIKQYMKQV